MSCVEVLLATQRLRRSARAGRLAGILKWIERCFVGALVTKARVIHRLPSCEGLLDVIDSVSAAIVAIADDGTIVFANERASQLFARRGQDPESALPELVGASSVMSKGG